MNSKYTKEVFISALEHLLKTKHIDKIRVEEICRECGLNKKTFYYHFESKYDLATYLYNQYVTDELKEFGYEDYFSQLAKGDERLNDLPDKDSAEILQRLVNLWSGIHSDINRNLVLSEDYHSPLSTWQRESLNGKRNLLLQRLEAAGRRLEERELDLATILLNTTSEFYYENWTKKYGAAVPREEAEHYTHIMNSLLEYWVGQGKPVDRKAGEEKKAEGRK